MAEQLYGGLSEMQLDVLREIGNIGSGNAATSLAGMLSQPVNIQVPQVRILDYAGVVGRLGGPETTVVGLLLTMEGDVRGMMMFLLDRQFAHLTLGALLGSPMPEFELMDDMSRSAMQEVGNIMASSYVNALAELTGLTIAISVPALSIDMLGAILSVPAIHYAEIGDKIIYIEDAFVSREECFPSYILMIPEADSLRLIMEKLGFDA